MPQAVGQDITPARRRYIEDEIERLIGVLDAADKASEDLEDVGDDEPGTDREPSLGSIEGWCSVDQRGWAMGAADDRECADDSDEGSEEDARGVL